MPQPAGVITFPRPIFIMEPSAEQVRRDIMLLESNIKGYTKPLQLTKQIFIDDVKESFYNEKDPITGQKWPALSLRASRVPRLGILRRSETNARMFRSVVNKNAWGVSKGGVFLNTSRVPFYAAYHQQDESTSTGMKLSRAAVVKEAKRLAGVGFARGDKDRLNRIKLQAIENVKSEMQFDKGKGEIPQRRFIGPSPKAERTVVEIMDEWATDAIIIYKRGNRLVRRAR